VPPRPTFDRDLTAAEAEVMQRHAVYWKGLAEEGTAVIFGPVADPAGVWGVAILEVDDAAGIERFGRDDPAIQSGLGFRTEIYPMPRAVLRRAARPA
jgi:hypothetical protein